jgi:hypothetical protein
MGERTLYTSNDEQVVVTTRRLVLGSEQWDMQSIADVDVVSSKKLNFHYWLKLNERTIPNIIVGGICFILGFLFAWLAIGAAGFMNVMLIALALLMYIIAFYFVWRTWMLSLPDLYSLKLILKDPTGTQREHKAAYTWQEPMEAREVEQAVLQAVAGT